MTENAAGIPRPVGRLPQPAGRPAQGRCPACGILDPPAGVIVVRATLPQPIAAALLLARSLSPRERVAFELLGLGYDNRSMARTLEISERTVKRHVTAILGKLRLESRLQAGLTALIMSSAAAARPPPPPPPVTGPARPSLPATADWPEGRIAPLPRTDKTGWQRGRSQEDIMTFDALAALRRAGNPVDLMTAEQQKVLAQLTETEVDVLNSVKGRMDAVCDIEVEAHSAAVKIV